MKDEDRHKFQRLIDQNNMLQVSIRNLEEERHRLIEDIERYRNDILQLHERLKYQNLPSAFVTGNPLK